MLVKYYLNYILKIPFENFALALENAWASPDFNLLATRSKNKKQWTSVLTIPFLCRPFCHILVTNYKKGDIYERE